MSKAAREWTPTEEAWMRVALQDGAAPELKLFTVHVTREYEGDAQILARSKDEAQTAGKAMAADLTGDSWSDDSAYASEIKPEDVNLREHIWIPGPDPEDPAQGGTWVSAREWLRRVTPAEPPPLPGQVDIDGEVVA